MRRLQRRAADACSWGAAPSVDDKSTLPEPWACEIRDLAAARTWTFAKTMAHIPHYWTRNEATCFVPDASYVALFNAIHAHGVNQRFGKYTYRHLYPANGRKYWAMTSNVTYSNILNRARV
jgi:hypothetical protein